MKITDVQTLRLRAPIPAEGQVFSRSGVRSTRSTTLLRVETDKGISGIGSAPVTVSLSNSSSPK